MAWHGPGKDKEPMLVVRVQGQDARERQQLRQGENWLRCLAVHPGWAGMEECAGVFCGDLMSCMFGSASTELVFT